MCLTKFKAKLLSQTRAIRNEEAIKREVKDKIDELDRQGSLPSIIEQACKESERVESDLGRGGKRGFEAFVKIMDEKAAENKQGASFRQSLNTLLKAPDDVSSALEEELIRRFPLQLRWDRNAAVGPTITTIANRLAYATGEILRRFKK